MSMTFFILPPFDGCPVFCSFGQCQVPLISRTLYYRLPHSEPTDDGCKSPVVENGRRGKVRARVDFRASDWNAHDAASRTVRARHVDPLIFCPRDSAARPWIQ